MQKGVNCHLCAMSRNPPLMKWGMYASSALNLVELKLYVQSRENDSGCFAFHKERLKIWMSLCRGVRQIPKNEEAILWI